jgi:hypothetical protein
MGSVKTNISKWFDFEDGTRLYADTKQGVDKPNLDVALEQSIGNELDASFGAICGDTVLSDSAWKVVPGATNLSVSVQAGRAFIKGQPAATSVSSSDIVLAANTAAIKVYAEMDNTQNTFNLTISAWTPRFSSTTGALPANSIQLATVNTSGITASTIPLANITDTRPIHEPQSVAVSPVTEITPTETAKSIRQLGGMLAYKIREIIGSASPPGDWKDVVPASLYTIWTKFNATTGHKHTGAANDAPKIDATNVNFTPLPGSTDTAPVLGITANTTQLAIEQLAARKLNRNGTNAMTGELILAGDPVNNLGAAPKQYVDRLVNMKQIVNVAMGDPNADYYTAPLTEQSVLASPLTINAQGGLIEFRAGGQMQALFQGGFVQPNFLKYEFKLYRNGALLFTDYVIPSSQLIDPAQLTNPVIMFFDIPTFYDKPGGTTTSPLATTYDLRLKITVNFAPYSPYYVPGLRGNRWWAIES